jgi:hypothetical protein
MGYFGLANQLRLFAQLDGWIRRRIRMCYWKQWRRPDTRVLARATGTCQRQLPAASGSAMPGLSNKACSASKLCGQNLLHFVEPRSADPQRYVVWGGPSAMAVLTRFRLSDGTNSACSIATQRAADSLEGCAANPTDSLDSGLPGSLDALGAVRWKHSDISLQRVFNTNRVPCSRPPILPRLALLLSG